LFKFLPDVKPFKIDSAPLAQVVAQIKFDSQGSLSSRDGANLFRDRLGDRYPRLLGEQQQTYAAGLSGVTTATVSQWRLTDLAGDWACVVGPEQLVLETSAYSTWTEMHDRLAEALDALREVTRIRVRERIGLRYINHVKPTDSGSYDQRVVPELLGLVSRPGWQQALTVSLGQTILREDNVQLAVRYGTGVGVVEPADRFVIDIDCSDEQPSTYDDNFDVLAYFDTLNDVAYRCFCACVPASFRVPVTQ
jgi:uncharacterized protein (TIGR04255 family)